MPARPLDLRGQRYGRLVALNDTGKRSSRNAIWLFMCDCGNVVERKSGEVRRGACSSCGCLAREGASERMEQIRHLGTESSTKHGMTGSREWVSWDSMKQRCTNEAHKSYHNYGGRGIKVCQEWIDSFEAFLKDMGERPEGMTLERVDTDGNYCPENCVWATRKQQANNRRSNHDLVHGGITKTVKQWSEEKGISDKAILYRLKAGWSVEDAINKKTTRSEKF